MSIMLILICFGVFILIAVAAGVVASLSGSESSALSDEPVPFEKKPYVFDVVSELNLYRLLIEICGDKFYIFPQVGYSHLITLKRGADRKHRNRFDKKSADFVLCDKERAVARLVIELDGKSHLSEKRMERDAKIDSWMHSIGLPILHLNPVQMDRLQIETQIRNMLEGEK